MVRRLNKKPSARLVKLARKYKVKISLKRGSKRIYKSEKLLKKQIKMKMRKVRKSRKTRRSVRRVRRVRRSRFGNAENAGTFMKDVPGYGYNMPVNQVAGVRGQSSEWVDSLSNGKRPADMKVEDTYLPTYGTYGAFFDQDVPRVIPPNWQFMGQPDGTSVGLGSPFYRYKDTGFGRKKRRSARRYNVKESSCNKLRMRVCKSNPNCTYAKRRGCRRRKSTVKGGLVYQGPSLAGFGKRRYNVKESSCNKLRMRVCKSHPNCTYAKGRGCRRRKSTVRGGLVYQGPSLAGFGRKYY